MRLWVWLGLTVMSAAACRTHRGPEAPAPAGIERVTIRNGEDVLRRMHQVYAGIWYRTLTFTQRTAFADGRVETWYHAMALPGRLRIDVAPVSAGNTRILRHDSVYAFQRGHRERATPLVHPLLVLGFDVYADSVERTIDKVRGFGIDLARLDQGSWLGRPVWIIGAQAGDSTSPQVWIDSERLVFLRLIERRPTEAGSGDDAIIDTRFNRYQRLAGGWIAPEVEFRVNGAVRLTETYVDIRADEPLDPRAFEVDEYRWPEWLQ